MPTNFFHSSRRESLQYLRQACQVFDAVNLTNFLCILSQKFAKIVTKVLCSNHQTKDNILN